MVEAAMIFLKDLKDGDVLSFSIWKLTVVIIWYT